MRGPSPQGVTFCGLSFRPATPADTDFLLRIINDAYAASEGHVFPGSTRTERTGLLGILHELTIAEIDGRIAGCIHITIEPPDAHYGPLAVDLSLQTAGLGSALIEYAEERARAAGCTRMKIEVVKQGGRVPFYERRGYVVTKEHDGQTWNGGADWGASGPWQMVDMEKAL
jgi:GNAT superfamily N-acetyltransferase